MTSTHDHGPIEDRVRAILQKSIVCDLTLPWGPDNENKEATIPRWRASGFDFVSLTVALDWTSLAATVGSIAAERARFQARADRYVLVETVADIERAKREGKCAIGFHFQGTNPLDGNLAMVETYYRLGVRHMLLAYNQTNAVGAGCHEPVDEGLTGFGRELIAEMNRVGMIVDCTHTGARTTMQAMEITTAPPVFSHSLPRALYDHERNISDEQIRMCASKGGVIGINGVGIFLGDNDPSPARLAAAIDYITQLVGPEHVALGLDYVYYMDSMLERWRANQARYPRGYPEPPWYFFEPERLPELVRVLLDRGYADAQLQGILGGNFLRVCRQVWKA